MLFNSIKIALRNLVKQRLYTIINVLGMSIAFTAVLLIGLYVVDEYRFDHFFSKADRIYRVGTIYGEEGQEERTAAHAFMISQVFRDEFPEVEDVTRLGKIEDIIVHNGTKVFNENRGVFAEASIFNVFDYRMTDGHPETALQEPNSLVLTRSTAQKYFNNQQVVGSTLLVSGGDQFEKQAFTVTGIVEEPPSNTSFPFDIMLSSTSDQRRIKRYYTFVLLQSGASPEQLQPKFPSFEKNHLWGAFRLYLTPLTDIHFFSDVLDDYAVDRKGNHQQVYIFSLIGLFILVIAGANFINLSTASATNRTMEIGMRKVLGASRTGLINQFLAESIFLVGLAFFATLSLGEVVLPYFNDFTLKDLNIPSWNTWYTIPVFVTASVAIGFLVGLYPALYLTRIRPTYIFQGNGGTGSKKGAFRRSLVTTQFVISIALIACTLFVYQQMQFMRNKDLGFNKENVVVIKYPHNRIPNINTFVQDIRGRSGIKSAGYTSSLPGKSQEYEEVTHYKYVEHATSSEENVPDEDVFRLTLTQGDQSLVDVLDLEIVSGRGFSSDFPNDSNAVLINETAAGLLGFEDPIGQKLYYPSYWGSPGDWTITPVELQIVGVVRDYHFRSMHRMIQPLIIYHYDHFPNKKTSYVAARLLPGNLFATLETLRSVWNRHIPERPMEYLFLDDQFDQVFRQDLRFGKTTALFTLLAIIIACSGLFALSVFSVSCRTKEIGVRKVLGASAFDIIGMLYKETTLMIVVSLLIALPATWYAITQWLQNYAYRIDVSPITFLIVGAVALALALVTVSFQAFRAASSNPIDAIQYE